MNIRDSEEHLIRAERKSRRARAPRPPKGASDPPGDGRSRKQHCFAGHDTGLEDKLRGAEHQPPLSQSFRRFLPCRLCLAPARLHPPHQKSIKNLWLRGALQLSASQIFAERMTNDAGNTLCIHKSFGEVTAEISR